MFFYEWVERCKTGKALLYKKMFFEKYTLLFDTSFIVCLFLNFYFFLPSQTWLLGFSLDRLQKILCLVFCLFVVFLFFLCVHIFFPKTFYFFSKISHFGICLLGFLRIFSPLFCYCFHFLFIVEVTAFCSKFSFMKGEPAQLRYHSSEFSVSIMHSSLLL